MEHFYFLLFSLLPVIFIIWKWNFIQQTMNSSDPNPSAKRLTVIFCLVAILVGFFAAVFLGKMAPQYMWMGLVGIVVAGLGLTVAEKIFGNSGTKDNNQDNTNS